MRSPFVPRSSHQHRPGRSSPSILFLLLRSTCAICLLPCYPHLSFIAIRCRSKSVATMEIAKYPTSLDQGIESPLVIPVAAMPQRIEVLYPDEDWTGVTSPAARRKLQNRLNQRAYSQFFRPIPHVLSSFYIWICHICYTRGR
jgi:hypothetical protein